MKLRLLDPDLQSIYWYVLNCTRIYKSMLSEVCKSLHHITIPHLYKSLVFTTRELSLSSLCMQIESVEWDLRYTRELGFRAPVHHRRASRCVHFDDGMGELPTNSTTLCRKSESRRLSQGVKPRYCSLLGGVVDETLGADRSVISLKPRP